MLTGAVTSVELSERSVSVGGAGSNGPPGAVPPAVAWVLSTLTRSPDDTVPVGAVFADGAAKAGETSDAAPPRSGQDGVVVVRGPRSGLRRVPGLLGRVLGGRVLGSRVLGGRVLGGRVLGGCVGGGLRGRLGGPHGLRTQRLEVDDVARRVGDRRLLQELGQRLGAADVGDEL